MARLEMLAVLCIALIWQLLGVLASTVIDGMHVKTIDDGNSDGDCEPHLDKLDPMWDESIAMAQASINAINKVKSSSNNWLPGSENARIAKAVQAVWGVRVSKPFKKISASDLAALNEIQGVFQAMITFSNANNPGDQYWLYCDETFMHETTTQFGTSNPLDPQKFPYGAYANIDRPSFHYKKHSEDEAFCKANVQAFTVQRMGTIALCKASLQEREDYQLSLSDIQKNQGSKIQRDDYIGKYYSLPGYFLHEMAHLFGDANDIIDDQPAYAKDGNLDPDGGKSYGFWKCTFLANSPNGVNLAKKNADNYHMFALAMYLNAWDWGDGIAKGKILSRRGPFAKKDFPQLDPRNDLYARYGPHGVPIATIGTEIVRDMASKIVVDKTQTLSPGGLAVTDQGQRVSLGYSDLYVGTSDHPLPTSLRYAHDHSSSGSGSTSDAVTSSRANSGSTGNQGSSTRSAQKYSSSDTQIASGTSESGPASSSGSVPVSAPSAGFSSAFSTDTSPTTSGWNSTFTSAAGPASSSETSSIRSSGSITGSVSNSHGGSQSTSTGAPGSGPASATASQTSNGSGGGGGAGIITVTDASGHRETGKPTTITNPPEYSSTTFSNPSWTSNTVTTVTDSDGHPTAVPIIFAGGAFVGLFGLGIDIGAAASLFTVFSLPGLPPFILSPDGTPEVESDPDQPSPSNSDSQPSNSKPTSNPVSTSQASSSANSVSSSTATSSGEIIAITDPAFQDPAEPTNLDSGAQAMLDSLFAAETATSGFSTATASADSLSGSASSRAHSGSTTASASATPTAQCPDSTLSNSTNFSYKFPKGSNTFNLDYEMTNHPEVFRPGTQWLFAEPANELKSWSVMGNPTNPATTGTNQSFISFSNPLDSSLTSLIVIGVANDGLTDNSDYSISLYAYGAPSDECGGHLPSLPAAPPTAPPPPPPPPPPPAPSQAIVIYAILEAIPDGEGTPAGSWAAVDVDLDNGGSGSDPAKCAANDAQQTPNIDMKGHWDDAPATWAFSSPIHSSLTSCTYNISPTDHASSATGTLQCPGLPTPVPCPPVQADRIDSCLVGDTFELPGLPGLDFGGDVSTSEKIAYCQW